MGIIQVENLKKSFSTKKGPLFRRKKERVKAVDGISFSIEPGEIFSLLGPNGAGKTTTIKILATLLIPDSGQALVNGFDVARDDHEVRKVMTAVLPGERTLFWKLTVKENLNYFGSLYGLKQSLSAKRIIRMQVDAWENHLNDYFRDRFEVHSIDTQPKGEEIQVHIKCSGNGFSLVEVSNFLSGYGVTAHNISFDQPSLEDVFIEMTGSTISEKEGANGAQVLV